MKYTDQTLMPFGKYYGEKLCNVPATYLLWLYRECALKNEPLVAYIKEHLKILEAEEKILIADKKSFNKNLYR